MNAKAKQTMVPKPRGRASIPTSNYSKSFLAKAWEARNELSDSERRGFAQFLYVTLCGHIESKLAAQIKHRLLLINLAIRWDSLPPMRWINHGVEEECSVAPLVQSIQQIFGRLEEEAETAPLQRLIEIFGRIFPEGLRDVLGADLFEDLDAVAKIRNVFAHGRDLVMEFEGTDEAPMKGTLDRNALKKPAVRLYTAGIIKSFEIDGLNYCDFHAHFYSDEAMMYFYRAIESIETKLESFSPFPPEKALHGGGKLPSLSL